MLWTAADVAEFPWHDDNPSRFTDCGPDCPVETVSYPRIQEFLASLGGIAGERFRLPTEAEWELACRAGRRNAFGIGEAIPRGLYDMNGNVWEWCEDEYCPYPDAPVVDPRGSCGGVLRVIRGGSWYFGADSARCGLRYTHRPLEDGPSLGFRVVREIPLGGDGDGA